MNLRNTVTGKSYATLIGEFFVGPEGEGKVQTSIYIS